MSEIPDLSELHELIKKLEERIIALERLSENRSQQRSSNDFQDRYYWEHG